jgi:hypothetical protein
MRVKRQANSSQCRHMMRKRPTHRNGEADGHANNDQHNHQCGGGAAGYIAQSFE